MKKQIYSILCMLLFMLVAPSLTSCSDDEAIGLNNLTVGKWSESYDDPNFSMDGSLIYEFKGTETTGEFTLTVYNVGDTSGDLVYTGMYVIDNGYITLTRSLPEYSNYYEKYKIVKLNDKEMAWQLDGTEYSRGTIGSDYRHFVKVK